MSRFLRLALCEDENSIKETNPEEGSEKTIKMTGPLSEVYTKALQVVYAKTDAESGLVAIESQANDVLMKIAMAKALAIRETNKVNLDNKTNIYNPKNNILVNVLNSENVDNTQLLEATNQLVTNKVNDPQSRNILVVDGGLDSATGQFNTFLEKDVTSTVLTSSLKEATESVCNKLGIELYYNFETLVEHL